MHPPNSLKDLNVNPKLKITKEKQIGVHSLTCNILRVKRPCWNFEMGSSMNDKRVDYSYGPTQAKQQVG
jgi:hypothetical protein